MPAINPVTELIKRQLLLRAPNGSYQDRYELYEPFRQRPILAATMDPSTINQASVRLLTGANRDWKISGTNAVDASSVLDSGGGVIFTTAGADNDQVILAPMTSINSVAQTAWRAANLATQLETRFEAIIELPALTLELVHVGLTLTAVLDLTTDDDQVKFQYSTSGAVSATNWTIASSIAGTDAEVDTGVAAKAAASIRLGIEISNTRVPRYYINGIKVYTGAALTTAITLFPTIGVQALTAAAKVLKVRSVRANSILTAK